MPLTDAQRERIWTAGRSYLGVPWRGHGRDHLGIDCVGVGENAYIEGGMPLPRTPPTYRGIDSKQLMAVLHGYFDLIPYERALPADLVIYRIFGTREAHLGLLVPPRRSSAGLNRIHCPMNRAVVESRFDVKLGDIVGFYTWR